MRVCLLPINAIVYCRFIDAREIGFVYIEILKILPVVHHYISSLKRFSTSADVLSFSVIVFKSFVNVALIKSG